MKFGKRIVSALLMFMLFSNAQGQSDDQLTIYVDNSYPPYMYGPNKAETDADGLYPRLLSEVAEQTKQKIEIKAYPWKRVLSYGAAGKGAVGGAYRNDERMKVYDYSLPLYKEKMVLFVNKNNQFEFNTLEDLEGKTIGVNRGWSYGQKFDAARDRGLFTVNVRNTPSENFKMLALGRIDCLILDKQSGDSYVRLLGMSDQITSLPNAFSINNGYLIIPKQLNMGDFLDEFNSALKRLQEDGTYNKIVQTFVQGTIDN